MQCAFCGSDLMPGQTQCPRCGGSTAPEPPTTGDVFSSAIAPPQPSSSASPAVGASTPSQEIPAYGDSPAPAADPEADLHTALVSLQDRQESIETKMVELPQPAQAPAAIEKKGLPDSRVARGVEDTLIEIKRIIYRFGIIGRIAFIGHILVVIGGVSPWLYIPHQGYIPGIESWGAAPLGLSLVSVGMLAWRFKRVQTHKLLPVLLHLLFAAALVVVMLWRYRETMQIESHIRPDLAFGFYTSGVGALLAFLGALVGLKDVR